MNRVLDVIALTSRAGWAEVRDIIRTVEGRGVRLDLDGTDIVFRGPRGALDAWLMLRLKTFKAEIIAELKGRMPAEVDPVDILERAAILEFCEGLNRAEADALALAEHGAASWETLARQGTQDD